MTNFDLGDQWTQMSDSEKTIRNAMYYVHEVERIFGTLTDKNQISNVLPLCDPQTIFLTPYNLEVFKRIVSTCVLSDPKFRPPNGYKILGFLTFLYQKQQTRIGEAQQQERNELNALYLKSRT
jgi:hypothetical protein